MIRPPLITDEVRERLAALRRHPHAVGPAEDGAARAVWSCLIEPGDGVAGRLIASFGSVDALQAAVADDRGAAHQAGIAGAEWRQAIERWEPRMSSALVRGALERAAVAGIQLLLPADARWPRQLDDLGDHAPVCLWVRGDTAAPTRTARSVGVVGARAATGYGEHVAMELAAELAGRGIAVVSGAAYGIDAAAHRAALAAGGTTIAILAGGADRAYPAGNTELIDRIAGAGAVLSEVPCGSAPTKWRFLQRNRLIAALAQATVVVEAGWRSGSLNTAHHAAMLGRPLGAVPGQVTSAASAGCHRVLREQDAQCITGVEDVLELIGAGTRTVSAGGDRTDERTRVRDALSARTPRTAIEIAQRAGMSPGDVAGQLGLLALDGEAVGVDGSWRRTAGLAAPVR
ncbi:MAG: DNA-processing protein DprA [Microbacterium sp.]|uniref:DNA-processing protein DprA n=1 Tax=Microbacterium sp. TaxID=51671 RepID=UPI003A8A8A86